MKNLEYLQTRLKFMGFGEKLNEALESNIIGQAEQFKLSLPGEFAKGESVQKVEYSLDFSRSKETDMYFFNRYQATLKNEDPAKEKSQTFYINNGNGITAKEAFNLLEGRAVNKDLTTADQKPYNAWLQLDFGEKDKHDNYKVRQFHTGYGYEVEKAIEKYPIKELNDPVLKIRLMESLEKGNIHQVTFERGGKEEKMFVEANPQYKNLNVYNAQMEKQFQGIEKENKNEVKVDKKESVKQDLDDENDPEKSKKASRKKGMTV